MARNMRVQMRGLENFNRALRRAASGDLMRQYRIWLEAVGMEFLSMVQDEIVRLRVVNTRLLLNSFSRGDGDCVFKITNRGLKLEVGTNVEYARYVNDGHNANPQGVEKRWVPGYWNGDEFVYDRSAKTGMLLKQQYIEGSHYFDIAQSAFESILGQLLERKLQRYLNTF